MSSKRHFLTVLLLAFLAFFGFGYFGVECNLETLFEKCCAIGRSKSTDGLRCEGKIRTPIADIAVEQQSMCLSTIDLCCIQSLRNIACESGKQAAKQNKNCNPQLKSDDEITYKHCCEACKLGIISASTILQCKLKIFHFGIPWDDAYETCCSEYSLPPVGAEYSTIAEEPSDLCQLLPGELCSHICVPVGGSYKCQCRPGYALMADGKSCKPDITENRCEKYNICDQNCFDNGETLECSCNTGYELLADNKTCVDINECNLKLDNCYATGQSCQNTVGSFECIGNITTRSVGHTKMMPTIPSTTTTTTTTTVATTTVATSVPPSIVCPQGYRYDRSRNTCIDIDECKEQQNACSRNTELCLNTIGSYRCTNLPTSTSLKPPATTPKCGSGFVYDSQRKGCVDVDECEENRCDSNEICQNQIGGYRCECKIGFQRDSLIGACVDVNECQLHLHNCPETARCDNTVGSYQCIRPSGCGTGYTLNLETNTCEDDNECALGIDNCRLLGPGWECRNIVGSFRCEKKRCDGTNQNCGKVQPIPYCIKGYELINGECVDIDECKQRPNACQQGENCVNYQGGYKCVSQLVCPSGSRYNNELNHCEDIDECAEQPLICDHNCINVYSSFLCTCNPGFRLHRDNRSCIDVNECEVYKDRRLCIGFCVNTLGSYKCQCPEGYRLGKSGRTCEDIDECANSAICNQPKDVCVNIKGSFRCNTITCPPNYIHDPLQKNRCVRVKDFCLINKNCTYWPMNYLFAYFSLTSNFPIPTTGQMEFYRMRGPTAPSTSSQFFLDLKNVQATDNVNQTTSEYFRLIHHSSNEVTIALVRSIQGPQDIELDLKMQYTYNGAPVGYSISKLFIYVSQYDF